jgi:predicted phage-related endonuclease
MNATYDEVEGRWKAAQLGNLIADKSKYEAMFHSRAAEKLLAARYALRKTKQDFEMSIFTEEEIRVFCKRTAQINKLEETHRSELQKRFSKACCTAKDIAWSKTDIGYLGNTPLKM